jgi:hypothetical protein
VSASNRLGVVLAATAVAAVGAVGVWMGLVATSVPNVDLGETVNDTVVVSTGTEDAGIEVQWRLHRDGDVSVSIALVTPPLALPPDFPTAERAVVAVELWCDARLRDATIPDGVELIEDGDDTECGSAASDEGVPARQIYITTIEGEYIVIRGHPVRDWTTSLAGQSTARSPRLILLTGGIVDPVMPFEMAGPGAYSTLTAVLESGPQDLLDLTVTPSGDVVESTSVMVQGDGDQVWVDSVTWALTFGGMFTDQATLEEGLARWTDPAGQTAMQLLLLLSGALIGVVASVVVERFFSWTLRVRSAAAADGEGAPPEGDAP